MKIHLERGNEDREIEFSGTVQELLDKLTINPQEVLVAKNGTVVPESENVSGRDEITIYSVISGG